MNFLRFRFFCVCFLSLIFTSHHDGVSQDSSSSDQANLYDQLFPYYVEACAVSRFQPKGEEAGGSWGHALMYLKGVCVDESSPYPKLRMCRDGEVDLRDGEAGVGISVDKMFKSVNWVAIPGKKLFYDGNLEEGESLTAEHFQKTVDEVLQKNLFRGVQLHDQFSKDKPGTITEEEWVARQTAGTDYAIRFARTSICASLPLEREHLPPIIDYLNQRNEEIFSGKVKFEWNPYDDNCAHTVHNSLAAAGIWKAKPMNQSRVKQILNIAIPSNEVANFAFHTQRLPDFVAVDDDSGLKANLIKKKWLPMRHGALLKVLKPHQPNDLFETAYDLSVLEVPFHKHITRKIKRRLNDARYTDLKSNLHFFKEGYGTLIEHPSSLIKRLISSGGKAKQADELDYVALQAEDVLGKINAIESSSVST